MRKHYLLPSEFAGFAATKYKDAKEKALKAKRDFLEKEKADAIVRVERQGMGLIYKEKTVRSGFTLPNSYEGYWLIKPKKNTIIGKRIQTEMDNVCELLEKWQWALEDALGLYESVYTNRQFEMTVCFPMPDGSVLVSQPKKATKMLSVDYQISEAQFNGLKELADD